LIAKKLRLWQVALLLLVLSVLLAGCGSSSSRAIMTGASWPGITVHDDTIYMAFESGVYAIDPETSEAAWVFSPSSGRRGFLSGPAQTFFAPPAAADELVVVTDYVNSLYALDPATGREKWSFKSDHRFIGGAAMDESYVYAGTVNGVLHALDRDSGEEVWTFSAERDIWSTPLLANGTLYMTSLDRHIYAIDAADGDLLWKFPAAAGDEGDPPMGGVVGTPTLHEGVLYFGSLNNHIYALDIETRGVLWKYETSNWMWSSPVVDEESDSVIGGDLDGHIFALDRESGRERWAFEADGPVVGAPVIGELADGTRVVYATSGVFNPGDSNLYMLDVEDGSETLAPTSIKAEFTTRFLFITTDTALRTVPVYAPPVLYEDVLLVGEHQSENPLHALDRETLVERWKFSSTGQQQQAVQSEEEQQAQSPLQFFMIWVLPFVVMFLVLSLLQGRRAER
jgi:outer membrane protein assembly factor BamB